MGFIIAGGIPFFVLISEILGPSYRGLLSVLISTFFGVGFVTLSLAAYLLGEWRSPCFPCSHFDGSFSVLIQVSLFGYIYIYIYRVNLLRISVIS